MRKVLFAALCSLLLVACGGNKYKVSGKIDCVQDGDQIYMCSLVAGVSLAPVDSTTVNGGKFVFEGETDTCEICILAFNMDDQGNPETCTFYLEPGNIKISYKDHVQTVGGTKVNNSYQKFMDEVDEINTLAMDVERRMGESIDAGEDVSSYAGEMMSVENQYKQAITNSIIQNADNEFGVEQLLDTYSMFDPIEVDGLLDALEPAFGHTYYVQELRRMVDVQLRTSVGCAFRDFKVQAAAEKGIAEISLSNIVKQNKLTLLDFWASWCEPCREEIPYLKKAYAEFHDKGFDIMSISVDENLEDWNACLNEMDMPWAQLLDQQPDETTPCGLYGIKTIPSNFMIDAEGTIVAVNLRQEELEAFLLDYFK